MFACLIVSRKVSLFFAGRKGSQPLKNRARGFFLVRQTVKIFLGKQFERKPRRATVVGSKKQRTVREKSLGIWQF